MKSIITSALMITALSFCVNSLFAQTFKDVFKEENSLTWLGIDFTEVKVIGHTDTELDDLAARQFSGINDLIINEPKKYELDKAFHKATVESDLSFVKAKNKGIDASKIKSVNAADETRFTNATVAKIVEGYNFGSKKGIGVLFIMESMSKTSEKSSMYVTFIDIGSKKILHTERMVEKVGGFGLRNYYAKSIYEALEDIQKSKYKEWMKS